MTTYEQMRKNLDTALGDMRILAGDIIGPSGASWQDVAGTAALHFRSLADQLEAARQGDHEPGIVFPSPDDE